MNALFFDYKERRIADSVIISSFRQVRNDDEDVLTVRGFGFPEDAEYIGFFNRRKKFELYHIVDEKKNEITQEITLYLESDLYELITEKTIADVRPTNTTAGLALSQALVNTRFEVGIVEDTSIASTRWFYCSPFAAVRNIESKWPVRAEVRYEISGARIEHRYIDLRLNVPIWRGKRFEVGKDVLTALFDKDRRNVVTALTGRGKGESVGDGYGRRINFSDVVWSKANGDPVDKPAGQDWIEDPEATSMYGVCGTRPRFAVVEFDDIENPEELLHATWNALQAACEPVLSGEMTAVALETIGFPHEMADYGDAVAFISEGRRARSTIVGIEREYAYDGADVFQFGKLSESSARQMANVKRDLVTTKDKASAGALIAQKNEGLLSGYIDTMKTQILSSGTKMYTDPLDGGLILEAADGSRAVKITGTGILIASEKTGTNWKWTLAIDGGGVVADTITTGVLNAAVVKILGTDRFYWDSQNIYIINPENSNRQIRIGLYDGENYGIGYTQDGGQTWQNAIGFDGVTISTTGFTKSYVQLDEPASPGVGDRWTKTAPKTWTDLESHTWSHLENKTWDEAAGYPLPCTYVWDGLHWIMEADMSQAEKQADELHGIVSQNESKWIAEFNRVGLAGKRTGITEINESGVSVEHSAIGGRSVMNADGFRLIDAKGNVIGGLLNVDGTATSAVQRLMNAANTPFYVEVAPNIHGDGEDGLALYYNGKLCGKISAYSTEAGVGLRLKSYDGKLYLGNADASLEFDQLYGMGHHVHFGVNEPVGVDGDIWLSPVDPMDVS